jgi:hypothetical protein
MQTSPRKPSATDVIGWREWIAFPELGIDAIKVKVDTGARSSSLHAFDLELYRRRRKQFVRFSVHPIQRQSTTTVFAHAEIHDFRKVRSSTGHAQERPVIVTDVLWLGRTWPIELTLANRDEMGFRVLLGREAVRSRLLVDPGRSYFGGRPTRKQKRKIP